MVSFSFCIFLTAVGSTVFSLWSLFSRHSQLHYRSKISKRRVSFHAINTFFFILPFAQLCLNAFYFVFAGRAHGKRKDARFMRSRQVIGTWQVISAASAISTDTFSLPSRIIRQRKIGRIVKSRTAELFSLANSVGYLSVHKYF